MNPNPALALGTSTVSLLHMTAAYAAVAAGRYPVTPTPLPRDPETISETQTAFDPATLAGIRAMLSETLRTGTGRAAAFGVPAFGKTGTTQNNRDAWFIGYANDLVVGVWIGDDSNPDPEWMSGGGAAAQVWRDFMRRALAANKLRYTRPVTGQPAPRPRNPGAPAPETFIGDDGAPVRLSVPTGESTVPATSVPLASATGGASEPPRDDGGSKTGTGGSSGSEAPETSRTTTTPAAGPPVASGSGTRPTTVSTPRGRPPGSGSSGGERATSTRPTAQPPRRTHREGPATVRNPDGSISTFELRE